MNLSTRTLLITTGLLSIVGIGSADAQVVYTQPYVYATPRASNAAILPGFSPRGGIGTTPFLGNSRGLGAYSHNFDADYRRPVTQTQTYRRGLFGRRRAW